MPYKDPAKRRAYNLVYQREYYRNHKVEYWLKNRARKRAARQFLSEVKQRNPCARCGESDLRCLDFHHQGIHEKFAELSNMATDGAAIVSLERELQKCIVLCKNCHAKEHFKGNGRSGEWSGALP
jgi:5-methylcytosine-specific restriction endonuclease McrA